MPMKMKMETKQLPHQPTTGKTKTSKTTGDAATKVKKN